MQEVLSQVRTLHRQQNYLEAYAISKSLWTDPRALHLLTDASSLIQISQLSNLLGGSKLSEALIRRAVKRFPEDPWVQFNYANRVHGFKHHYDKLKHYESNPFSETGNGQLDGLIHAQRAVDWAYVREFGLAHEHMEQAFRYESDPARLHYFRARLLLGEDRPIDALADAEQAFELKPLATYALNTLNQVLARLNRQEEAAERTWQMAKDGAAQNYGYIQTVMRSQGAVVDRAGSGNEAAERMLFLCDELERTAPLADGQTNRSIRLSQIDAYLLNDQLEKAAELAADTGHAFYGKVFKHYETRKPNAKQVVHTHTPVLQDRMHCLPASVSVVLSHFGDTLSQHDIASELTMEGTSVGEMGYWLRKRGYQVVHFMATEESVRKVLDYGIPFVYHESYDDSGHSMAMVGHDDRLGVFLIHDPGYHRLTQVVASSVGSGEEPIGAHGMLVLPKDFDPIELPREWVQPVETYFDFYEACSAAGQDAGEKQVDTLALEFPTHPVTRYLRAEIHNRRSQHAEAQELLTELYAEYPRCVYFRRLLLRVLRSQENTALMREVLREMVRKGSVRGIKPNKKFRLPMATYKCQYADYVRLSADGLGEANRYIEMALRQEPSNSEPYHILGHILAEEERGEEVILAYRLASRLAPHNSHYAYACFEQMKRFQGLDTALDFMKSRAERLGRHPRGMDAWDDYVRALEDAGNPKGASDEMKMLLETHADNLTAHSYAGKLFARLGEWDAAWAAVNHLNTGGNEALYLSAVLDLFWYQRDLEPGLKLAERWVELEPWNRDARWAVLRFMRNLHDNAAAFAVAEAWYNEKPDNEMIENIYLNRLGNMDRREQKIVVLQRRVARNPKDAWAWRELGFDYAALMTGIAGEARETARAGLCECIEKSQELSPGWSSKALEAELAEAEGRYREALDLWLEALAVSPDYEHAMKRTWELSASVDGALKEKVLETLRGHMFARVEIGDTALIYAVGDRYGFEEAADLLLALKERFPNAPELESCRAFLVLNYSAGALNLGSRSGMLPELQDARKRYPAHRGIMLALAETWRREGEAEQAKKGLEEWIEQNRTDTDVVRRLAQVLEEQGRAKDTEQLLNRTVEHCPGEEEAYHLQAQFLGRMDRLEEAVEIYQKGLRKMPENIWLREKFGDFCLMYGYDALAVQVSREGTEIYPDGAFLWFQYGRALHKAEWTEDGTDPAVALRKALEFNATLYTAADLLAVILDGRSRYTEAQDVMKPFLEDTENAIYARARIVTTKRNEGQARSDSELMQEAVGEAMAIADETPDYEWIWRRLIEWIGADKSWELAKDVFSELPPVMLTAPYFRASRLQLLRKAGVENLEDDWRALLEEHPKDTYLHNECFDEFWKTEKQGEAVSVLEELRKRNGGDLWTDIRLTQAYAKYDKRPEAVETARRIWQNQAELSMDDDNASTFSWDQIFTAPRGLQELVVDDFIVLLGEHHSLRPQSVRQLCEHLDDLDEPFRRRILAGIGRTLQASGWEKFRWWLRSFVAPESESCGDVRQAVLKLLVASKWANGMHFSGVLMAGGSSAQNVRLADWLCRLKPELEQENIFVWGALGFVYFDKKPEWLIEHVANWRERPGVKSWHVLNYLIAHFKHRPAKAKLRLKDSLALLEEFQHETNHYAMAWLAFDSVIRTETFDSILPVYNSYRMYLDRDKEEYEFLPKSFEYMPQVLPYFIELAEKGWSKDLENRFKRSAGMLTRIDWVYKAWKKLCKQKK